MVFKEIDINTRNWVDSAQDMEYWRTLVNAALNLQAHKPWSYLNKEPKYLKGCLDDVLLPRRNNTIFKMSHKIS